MVSHEYGLWMGIAREDFLRLPKLFFPPTGGDVTGVNEEVRFE